MKATFDPRRRPRRAIVVAIGLTLSAPGAARAQPAGPSPGSSPEAPSAKPDYARANQLAAQGFEAFDRGDWAEAHERFAAAEQAAHSPVFVLYMARCKRELGEIDAARALYQRVADEALADDAPVPFRSAQDDANEELETLSAMVPVLSVTLEGATADDALTLDGAPVAMELRGSTATLRRQVAAGSHRLVVTRAGAPVAERQIELKPGQTVDTAIVLPAAAPPPTPAASTSPEPRATITTGPNLVPAYVVLGIAGAGAVVGAVMGGLALSQDKTAVDELSSCADDGACAEAEETRDQALTFAHVSTTSFVIASVAAATGVVLILTASEEEVAVGVGPGSLQLNVRF